MVIPGKIKSGDDPLLGQPRADRLEVLFEPDDKLVEGGGGKDDFRPGGRKPLLQIFRLVVVEPGHFSESGAAERGHVHGRRKGADPLVGADI